MRLGYQKHAKLKKKKGKKILHKYVFRVCYKRPAEIIMSRMFF